MISGCSALIKLGHQWRACTQTHNSAVADLRRTLVIVTNSFSKLTAARLSSELGNTKIEVRMKRTICTQKFGKARYKCDSNSKRSVTQLFSDSCAQPPTPPSSTGCQQSDFTCKQVPYGSEKTQRLS
ncbi:hypothetical protein PoB_003314700 [Plakobranchus ocellatus]|uniref:Uncharacterized protein n=1 Tax=Plakobranchus ocellatus TaxID=259542 RepID=A0AAV4AIA3_9GAST|nr:hypothetical protein PoB_003314700 [Plakobranchus ocellatus]